MRAVTEERSGGEVPLWRQPEWMVRFPWLAQATSGAGEEDEPFDLGLAGEQPVGAVMQRWREVRDALGMPTAIHSRQVHGVELLELDHPVPPGLLVCAGYDGHLTDRPGLLLSVSAADCVPVFLVDAVSRAVAAVHAGWRGVAGGVVERAVQRMAARFGTRPESLWAHAGPAICGECYEVGPEVHRAVHPGRAASEGPTPIDLRAAIGERLERLGVPPLQASISTHCTRCGPGAFFSHRAGSRGRHMGLLGRRD